MRNRLVLAALLEVALFAQPPEPIHVEGRVLSTAGQPLEGALFTLINPQTTPLAVPGAGSPSAGKEGALVFDSPPGAYVLMVAKPGYLGQTLRLTLTAGQKPAPLIIRLVPAATITGRVLGRDGMPVAKALVTAFRYTYVRGARSLTPAGGAQQANDAGEYRIPSLSPGRYYLRVEPKAPGVATYYPGALDPFAAVGIDVETGVDRSGVDIRQLAEPVFRIRGRALDAGGKPAVSVALTILPEKPIETSRAPDRVPTAADGSFEFKDLLPGRYIIRAIPTAPQDPLASRWAGRAAVVITRGDIEDLEIRVNEGGVFAGSVAMEDDSPLPATPIRVSLIDAEQTYNYGNLNQPVQEGKFRMERVQPEKFYLSVSGPENVYVKSVHVGGLDVTRVPLDLTFGGADNVRIVLGAKPGTVTVSTKPRASVALWPDVKNDGESSGVRYVVADDNGVARFTNVRPEKYWVAAFEDVEAAFVRSPEFLTRMKFRAKDVDVTAGASLDRMLEPVDAKTAAAVIQLIP